jgi:thiol-disulfide isomerase/thioredoxin
MIMKNMKKGFAAWAVVIIIALISTGAVYFLTSDSDDPQEKVEETENTSVEKTVEEEAMEEEEVMGDDETSSMMEGENMEETAYSGTVLAGNKSLLLEFNNADYQKALAEEEVVVLYFFANWCPLCKAEFPKMESAFDKLDNPDVVGFRVSFKDNQTDNSEKDLAKEFGVAYQHTKVIIKNGERVLKSPDTWEESRYISEINDVLN